MAKKKKQTKKRPSQGSSAAESGEREEKELPTTKQDLQGTSEQLEASNEEHKASNEEIMSMNKELQSTNEELESSKEEIQSLNEELNTVNNQLTDKLSELEAKHNDLQNLTSAIDIPIICLDRDLRVRWFTPATRELVPLTRADQGRPLADFAQNFRQHDLIPAVQKVLDKLMAQEQEVECEEGCILLLRIIPYRTEDDRIAGVVITFVDISSQKRAEQTLLEAKDLADKIIDTVREAIIVLDDNLRVVSANQSFYEKFRVAPAETEGQLIYNLGNGQWDIPNLRQLLDDVLPEDNVFNDFVVEHEFETIGRRLMVLNARRIDSIQMILLAIEDITDLLTSEQRFRSIFDMAAVGIAQLDREGHFQLGNETFCNMLGYDDKELLSLTIHDITYPDDWPEVESQMERIRSGQSGSFMIETRNVRKDGSSFWVSLSVSAVQTSSGKLDYFVSIIQDIELRKKAEEGLRKSEEQMRLAASAARFGAYSYDIESDTPYWSPELYAIHGLSPNEPLNRKRIEDLIHPDDRKRFREFIEQAIDPSEKDDEYEGEFRIITLGGGVRWMADRGRIEFTRKGKNRRPVRATGMVADVTERKQAEEKLKNLNETLEKQVSERTEMLQILQDITRMANEARTVEEAMWAALKRIAQYNGWEVGNVWKLADDGSGQMVHTGIWFTTNRIERALEHLNEFRQISQQKRFSPGEGLIGVVVESGKPHWVDNIEHFTDWQRDFAKHFGLQAAIAFPVTANGKVVAVLEFFSDHPTKHEARFMEIMPNIGIQLGHVIERKQLEKAIDAATTEQMRYFAQELHDSIAQQLTGTTMMSQVLLEILQEAGSEQAPMVEKLGKNLREAHNQVRRLSHGLMPVEVDAEGLMQALGKLIRDSRSFSSIEFDFQCEEPITMENNEVATHLYRIAQEAIQNAIKHGNAKHITVVLNRDNKDVVLVIQDDGGGFSSSHKSTSGTGHRIMEHRAALISGQLQIESEEGVGVTVTCRVRQPNLNTPKR